MTSLAAATSSNGNLRFMDADGNGLLNSGDRLEVRLVAEGLPNDWEAHVLRIGNFSAVTPSEVRGVHLVLHGAGGPLETIAPRQALSALVDAARHP